MMFSFVVVWNVHISYLLGLLVDCQYLHHRDSRFPLEVTCGYLGETTECVGATRKIASDCRWVFRRPFDYEDSRRPSDGISPSRGSRSDGFIEVAVLEEDAYTTRSQ